MATNQPGAPVPVTPVTPTTPVTGGAAPPPAQPQVNPGQRQRGNPYGIDQRYRFRNNQAIFRRILYTSVRPGAIIAFQYTNWRHDPYPLVLSTGRWASGKVAGVNLHYLTFRYIRFLLNQFCGKHFAYQQIRGNLFIKNSFRCYKQDGMRNIRLLDCEFLIASLGRLRSFNPTEVAAMRQWVREQLQRKLNQTSTSTLLDQATTGVHGDVSDTLSPNFAGGRYGNIGIKPGFDLPGSKPTYDGPDTDPTI